jgi:hypothetical protein
MKLVIAPSACRATSLEAATASLRRQGDDLSAA